MRNEPRDMAVDMGKGARNSVRSQNIRREMPFVDRRGSGQPYAFLGERERERERGLPPSSSIVMMRTAVIHFISQCMRLPRTILPHLTHTQRHTARHIHTHAHTQAFIINHCAYVIPLSNHTHLPLKQTTYDSQLPWLYRPGTAVWTVFLSECVASWETMTSVSDLSHTLAPPLFTAVLFWLR